MATITRIRTFLEGVAGGPAYVNHYFAGDGSSAGFDNEAVGDFWTDVAPFMALAVDWRTDSNAAIIDSITGDITGLAPTTPVTGSGGSSGQILPRATQLLIRWRTGAFQNGREIRGRTNIPYLTEAANTADGNPEPATIAGVLAPAAVLAEGVGSDQLVVWSRLTGAVPNVNATEVSSSWAVLRSRRD